jgi:hypothetical protein
METKLLPQRKAAMKHFVLALALILGGLALSAVPAAAADHYDRFAHPIVEGVPYGFWRNDARRAQLQAQREAARRTQARSMRQTLRNGHIQAGASGFRRR